jgi:anti-sigma factor RsiW
MTNNDYISPLQPGKGNKGTLPEDKLLAYLDGKLPPQEQYEVEQWLAEEGMENDAQEGLATLASAERSNSIGNINNKLHKKLAKPKRRTLRTDTNIVAVIVIILLLVVAAYCVIRCI